MPHILLVDDDPVLQALVAKLLTQTGHTVATAPNGEEGLVVAAQESFELILTDVMMPGIDGYEFVRQVRQQPQNAHTPIIIFTASVRGPDAAKAAAAGADGYTMKTMNVGRLNAEIQTVLTKRRTASGG